MNVKLTACTLTLASLLLLAASACGGGGEKLPFGLKSETVATVDKVKPMVFAPDGRLFLAEQYTGNIRVITPEGQLVAEPFATVQTISYLGLDWGVTGLALDPDFANTKYVYVFLTVPSQETPPVGQPTILRFTDQNNKGVDQTVVSDDFTPTSPDHPDYNANGSIHFGPDGFLYASLGDYDVPETAQDLGESAGKLLRISAQDGTAAPGNPFENTTAADPRIYAYGFREPFDFAFHPKSGAIYGTDNTPVSCEELNIIGAGKGYDWPDVGGFPFSDCAAGAQTKPIFNFSKEGKQPGEFLSFVEVSSIAFVSGDDYPTMGDGLLVCELGTGVLRRLTLAGANQDQVTGNDVLVKDCTRGVAVSPDGIIYYSTGKEIRRLLPPAETPGQ